MGGRRAVEEPHDFGKVMGKLVNYCRNYLPVIIIALIPLALKGVKYREVPAGKLLSSNLLIYGLGGLVAPFVCIKVIDLILVALGMA